jgi:hypothetical protein
MEAEVLRRWVSGGTSLSRPTTSTPSGEENIWDETSSSLRSFRVFRAQITLH